MKIDIFNHIFPKKFFDKYIDAGHGGKDIGKRVSNIQTIVDVDSRFRILDEFGDYVQVITRPASRSTRPSFCRFLKKQPAGIFRYGFIRRAAQIFRTT